MNYYNTCERYGVLFVLCWACPLAGSYQEALQQKFISQYLRIFSKPDVLYRHIPESRKQEFQAVIKETAFFVTKEGAPRARELKKHQSYVAAVAKRDAQRKKDMRYIENLWTQLLSGLTKAYSYLSEKVVMCGQATTTVPDDIRHYAFTPVAFNKDGSLRYYLDASKIDMKSLKTILGLQGNDQDNFAQTREELNRIRIGCVQMKEQCTEEECGRQCDLIILHTYYLQTTLDALVHALSAQSPVNQDAMVNDHAEPIYSVEEYIKSHAITSCAKKVA